MMGSKRHVASAFVVVSSLATSLVAGVAHAQTATGTATVTPLNNGLPYRLDVNGNDVTSQQRPQNLNPTGISFSDCMADMSLGFPVSISGFVSTALEVWVSTTNDCSQDASRGKTGTLPICWKVSQLGAMNAQAPSSTQINIRMQNIVGPQSQTSQSQSLVNWGSSACFQQGSYASVQMKCLVRPSRPGERQAFGHRSKLPRQHRPRRPSRASHRLRPHQEPQHGRRPVHPQLDAQRRSRHRGIRPLHRPDVSALSGAGFRVGRYRRGIRDRLHRGGRRGWHLARRE